MSQNEVESNIKNQYAYFVGDKLPDNWFEAFRLWMPIAKSGDAKAQFNIGCCYLNGNGVDENNELAMHWLMKSAEKNDPRAVFLVHRCYANGWGVTKDEKQSLQYLRMAADLGERRAFYALGKKSFAIGNQDKAIEYFTRANELHHPDAPLGLAIATATIQFGRTTETHHYSGQQIIVNGTSTGFSTGGSYRNPVLTLSVVNNQDESFYFGSTITATSRDGSTSRHGLSPMGVSPGKKGTGTYEMYADERAKIIELINYAVSHSGQEGSWHFFPVNKPVVLWGSEDVAKATKKACFVVTVCMEDEDDPVVVAFRRFRDEVLLKNGVGKLLINAYYRNGPALAKWVGKHPILKAWLRKVFLKISQHM